MMISRLFAVMATALGCVTLSVGDAEAEQNVRPMRPLITQAVNENQRVLLVGTRRGPASAIASGQAVADSTRFDHIQLLFRRSPEQEAAAARFVELLSQPNSTAYHQWLSAAEYGRRFGASETDIQKVVGWLKSKGFTVNQVSPGRAFVDFSGNAGQIAGAFHTRIRSFVSGGAVHVASDSDPQIPAALAPAIEAIVSLDDFHPRNARSPRPQDTGFCGGDTCYVVAPGDFATVYKLNPLFKAGYTGRGQTIAVIEDSNLYNVNDWSTFRSVFHLTVYSSGKLRVVHPAPANGSACANPGVTSDDGEAALDAEWASAAAPDATIWLASCASTGATDGVFQALHNMVNARITPEVISVSYAMCEAENGAGKNEALNRIYQQAAAEGITVYVASGDSGAAGCAPGPGAAWSGIGINGWGDSQYVVSVGGTDFSDGFNRDGQDYWRRNTGAPWSSARSYIPEIAWNDNCASTMLATYYTGSAVTYGSSGFCNTAQGAPFHTLNTSGGGPSHCYSGTPDAYGVVSGSCKGYPKPYWQNGVAGVPSDGVRDTPDISIFASNGVWGHSYATCYTDPRGSGGPCTGNPAGWAGNGGGTSYGAPVMAGIQALVNQRKGRRQGNAAPILYAFARQQYGVTGNPNCSADLGIKIEADCVFHDVVTGDSDVYCRGSTDCYRPSGTYGVLSTTRTRYQPSYDAGRGYDFSTGLGSVNAYNLVMQWPS